MKIHNYFVLVAAALLSSALPPSSLAQSLQNHDTTITQPALGDAIRRAIHEDGLDVIQQIGTPIAGMPRSIIANNKRAGTRTFLTDKSGVHIYPFSENSAEWSLQLQLQQLRRGGDSRRFEPTAPEASRNRVEYRYEDLREWYINQNGGLEQGLTIDRRFSGGDDPLQIDFCMNTTLDGIIKNDGRDAAFHDKSGQSVLNISNLVVKDANGRALPAIMQIKEKTLSFLVDDAHATYPIVIDPTIWCEEAKLLPFASTPGDVFGTSISVSGSTLVAGAPHNRYVGSGTTPGRAVVFVYNPSTQGWLQHAILTSPNGNNGEAFGYTVRIDGDMIAVSAPLRDVNGVSRSGAVDIFTRSGNNWLYQQTLTAFDGIQFDGVTNSEFGIGLDLHGGTIVIGAPQANGAIGNSGAAYVYIYNGSSWVFQAKLSIPAGGYGDALGISVALQNDRIILGAPNASGTGGQPTGAAYIFERSGGLWSFITKIIPPDGNPNGGFARNIAIDGDIIAIGTFVLPAQTLATGFGATYIYSRDAMNPNNWPLEQELLAESGENIGFGISLEGDTLVTSSFYDVGQGASIYQKIGASWTKTARLNGYNNQFGISATLNEDRIAVGASSDADGGTDAGAVYIFEFVSDRWVEQAKIHQLDASGEYNFGSSVAIDGDTVVVGAPQTTTPGAPGFAYVFIKTGTVWSPQAKLVASNAAAGDNFGFRVAIAGDVIVVGANQTDSNSGTTTSTGSVYIFERTGAVWTQVNILHESDAGGTNAANNEFGYGVAISGNKIVASALSGDTPGVINSGAAYIFEKTASSWSGALQTYKLAANDKISGGAFGASVAIYTDRVIVGAVGQGACPNAAGGCANPNSGAAYIFEFDGSAWDLINKIYSPDATNTPDRFGNSVSICGDDAIVGAHNHSHSGNNVGSVYVFHKDAGGDWFSQQNQPQELLSPLEGAGQGGQQFGISVDIDNSIIVIGAELENAFGYTTSGSSYVFNKNGLAWVEGAQFIGSDTKDAGHFGMAVAIAGSTMVVGAGDQTIGTNNGAAYIFSIDNNALIPYGAGTPGCFGPHVLSANTCPKINSTNFEFICSNLRAGDTVLIMAGDVADANGSYPFFGPGIGPIVYIDFFVSIDIQGPFRATAPANGSILIPVGAIPNDCQLVGKKYFAQAYILGSSVCPPNFADSSNGLEILIHE